MHLQYHLVSLTSQNMSHQLFQTGIVNIDVKEGSILVHFFIAKYFQRLSMLTQGKDKLSEYEITLS